MAPFFLGFSSCLNVGKKSMDADVIIVGAGLSGLNAALILESYGYKALIVEATDRIGGRVHTAKEELVPGHPELGANGIGGGYARLIDAAQKYGVEIGPMRPRTEPRKGELLYALKGNLIKLEDWPNEAVNPFTGEANRKMSPSSNAWAVYAKLNPFPKNDLTAWRNSDYWDWDRSVHKVLTEAGFSEEAIQLAVETNASYGTTAKDTSVLMYFQILNFISQQSAANQGGGGAAIGGNQRIPEAMARAFAGDILQSSPVSTVNSEKDHVEVLLENGKTLRAPYALLTLPASALRRISLSPKLPPKQAKGITEIGYTPCAQYHFRLKRPYWEEDGLPPSMWTDELAGRFMALKNDPNNPDAFTSCVAYTNGKVALELDKMEKEIAFTAIMKGLENIRPSLKGAIEPAFHWTWSNNRFAGGAYAYWKPGQISEFANELAKPHQRIYFAGEHTASLSRGMEGAMESGERAAIEIMNLL
ncbi:MAG: NAD(P)/FAD-dependent oxidoreductase [Bacteroidota bacterium]